MTWVEEEEQGSGKKTIHERGNGYELVVNYHNSMRRLRK